MPDIQNNENSESLADQQVTPERVPGEPVPETAPPTAAPENSTLDDFERRRSRIHQHFKESLEHPHTLTSIIGTVAADNMTMQMQLGELQREALGTGRVTRELVGRNRDTIDLMLKLSKQVTQLSQLYWKMRADAEAPPCPTEKIKAKKSKVDTN